MHKYYYLESFGCQMNLADSETIASILGADGWEYTDRFEKADVVFINTCAVRENAEQRIWNKLEHLKGIKRQRKNLKVGILGCMAQRVGKQFRKGGVVNIVAGPDAYRKLPDLLRRSDKDTFVSELDLSLTETYGSIVPHRLNFSSISGFVSITRGCNNFCTYCIVPYTRGRERSRRVEDIRKEISDLHAKNLKEVVLLGQNVNSYYLEDRDKVWNFPALIKRIAGEFPELRIRFTTSHPKDISDELIMAMADYSNICNHIHLPAQSGSNKILERMNRKYTREWYLERIAAIKKHVPGVSITTDMFTGFPGEADEDHELSLSLMNEVAFDAAFMFRYSERPGTYAAKKLKDDVPEHIKLRRLNEMIALQQDLSKISNEKEKGKEFKVLFEGASRRSENDSVGRTCHNKKVVVKEQQIPVGRTGIVQIEEASTATLFGTLKNEI